MLRICPYQNIKHTLLLPGFCELITAHGDCHASCVHSGRGSPIEDGYAADTLYYSFDFGLS
jgi:hypothetical protein